MSLFHLTDPTIWASLLTLTGLEIVLGIDNLIFVAILAARLPASQQESARRIGIGLALITRLCLLASITWIASLTSSAFALWGHGVSWRDLVLIGGGLFLITKATHELHGQVEGHDERPPAAASLGGFAGTITQIVLLDLVFSIDSVITAIGMSNQFWLMASAVTIAVVAMLIAATPLSRFVSAHPTVKTLALGFLLLIGTTLVADGFGVHFPKGYIYAAIGFSVFVEAINQVRGKRRKGRGRTGQGAAGERV